MPNIINITKKIGLVENFESIHFPINIQIKIFTIIEIANWDINE